jgi:hypothetical protein
MISPKLQALIRAVADSADDDGCSDDLTVASKGAIAALAAYVEQMSQEKYVDTGGYTCPYCRGNDIEYDGDVRLNGEKCYHDCQCRKCRKGWIEEYALTGYKGS